jgi:hypothetical protein
VADEEPDGPRDEREREGAEDEACEEYEKHQEPSVVMGRAA